MVDADNMRILATICSVVGSGLLAWRVKCILDALTLVAGAHEVNIVQLVFIHEDDMDYIGDSTKHLERAKGTWLLVIGFLLLAASGVLNFWALMC